MKKILVSFLAAILGVMTVVAPAAPVCRYNKLVNALADSK